tara:strand:- start:882 stop:1598 length:717 start_codon:yes stop_codon:yes gene_type:complete
MSDDFDDSPSSADCFDENNDNSLSAPNSVNTLSEVSLKKILIICGIIAMTGLIGLIALVTTLVIGSQSDNSSDSNSAQPVSPEALTTPSHSESTPNSPSLTVPNPTPMAPPKAPILPAPISSVPSAPSESNGPSIASSNSGEATFQSYKTPDKLETFSYTRAVRTNSRGHQVVDVKFSDGYNASYVFWRSGTVEIFSKDGEGRMDLTPGIWDIRGNGVVLRSKTGSITTFTEFTVPAN